MVKEGRRSPRSWLARIIHPMGHPMAGSMTETSMAEPEMMAPMEPAAMEPAMEHNMAGTRMEGLESMEPIGRSTKDEATMRSSTMEP